MYEYRYFAGLMHERGVTAYKVYKATGVAQSTLSYWKRGQSQPKANKLMKIADYLGTTVEYIITGDIGRKYSEKVLAASIQDRDDLQALFRAAADAEPEQVMQAAELLQGIRSEKET